MKIKKKKENKRVLGYSYLGRIFLKRIISLVFKLKKKFKTLSDNSNFIMVITQQLILKKGCFVSLFEALNDIKKTCMD